MKGEWWLMSNIMKRKLKGGIAPTESIEVRGFYKLSNLKIITFLLINRNRYNNTNQLNSNQYHIDITQTRFHIHSNFLPYKMQGDFN